MSCLAVGGWVADVDPDIETKKAKGIDADLSPSPADAGLARALDGLMQAMDNARAELSRMGDGAGSRHAATADVEQMAL
jgi:hypothetical protein